MTATTIRNRKHTSGAAEVKAEAEKHGALTRCRR